MSLTLDGTLGLNSINIGANTPGTGTFTTLNTNGNVTLGSASSNTVTFNAATVTLNNNTAISAVSTKSLTLNGGAGSNGLVLDASNNVGIGTTSPGVKLDVNGQVITRAANQFYSGTTRYGYQATTFLATGSGVNTDFLIVADTTLKFGVGGSATPVATLDSGGALTVPNIYTNTTAAVTYVAVSSAGLLQRGGVSALKYKQDIRDLESIDINKFRAVRYKSRCENDDQTIDYFGFIADEVDEAGIKELVIYDDAGEPEGFQYERMTVVLLKTIQELSAELNELKAKINH